MDSPKISRRAWVAALLCLLLAIGNNVKLMASQPASRGTAATSDIEELESVFRTLKTETPHTDSLECLIPNEHKDKVIYKDEVIEEDIVVVEEDSGGASTVAAQGGLTGGAGVSLEEGAATQGRGRSNATVESSGYDSDRENHKKAGGAGAAASARSAAAAAIPTVAASLKCEPQPPKTRVLRLYPSESVQPDSIFYVYGEDALAGKHAIPCIGCYKWPHSLDGKPYPNTSISYHFRSVDIDFPEMSYPGIESSFIKTKDWCISPYEIEWAPDANPWQDVSFLRGVPYPLLRYLANKLTTRGVLAITAEETAGKVTPYPLTHFLRKCTG